MTLNVNILWPNHQLGNSSRAWWADSCLEEVSKGVYKSLEEDHLVQCLWVFIATAQADAGGVISWGTFWHQLVAFPVCCFDTSLPRLLTTFLGKTLQQNMSALEVCWLLWCLFVLYIIWVQLYDSVLILMHQLKKVITVELQSFFVILKRKIFCGFKFLNISDVKSR